MKTFIQTTKEAGAQKFIIHARKALLKKLSPKENLNIPPLKYEFVYKLKDHFKNDEIIINGGIKTTDEIKNHLSKVDGAMIGRAIYHSPYFLAEIEKDEELSRELIQRIRDIALQVLLEWDEPLHGPSVSDTPPHGSKSPKQVVKLAIAEASKRLNSLSSNQKKIIEEALRGPSRRGSSSSTA